MRTRLHRNKIEGYRNGRFGLIQERRWNQARRYAMMKRMVEYWLEGEWRLVDEPCRCGRDHRTLESRSGLGIQRHCPVTWWGWLRLFHISVPDLNHFASAPVGQWESTMDDLVPNGIPSDEKEWWRKYLQEKGKAALEELEKDAPKLAARIREIVQRREAGQLEATRSALYPDEVEI
jgi:hypothetical protein